MSSNVASGSAAETEPAPECESPKAGFQPNPAACTANYVPKELARETMGLRKASGRHRGPMTRSRINCDAPMCASVANRGRCTRHALSSPATARPIASRTPATGSKAFLRLRKKVRRALRSIRSRFPIPARRINRKFCRAPGSTLAPSPRALVLVDRGTARPSG